MNMNQLLALSQLAQKLSSSPVMNELKNSPAFQQFEKQMAPMKEELLKTFTGMSEDFTSTEKEQDSSVDLDKLIVRYEGLINHHFKHSNGDTYALLDVTNAASEDQVKFPITAVYVSLTTSENWSRPLVEFSKKFTLI